MLPLFIYTPDSIIFLTQVSPCELDGDSIEIRDIKDQIEKESSANQNSKVPVKK